MCLVDCTPLSHLFQKRKHKHSHNTPGIQLAPRPVPAPVTTQPPPAPGSTVATDGGSTPSPASSQRSSLEAPEGRGRRATFPALGRDHRHAAPPPERPAMDQSVPRAHTDPNWRNLPYAHVHRPQPQHYEHNPYPVAEYMDRVPSAQHERVPGAWPEVIVETPAAPAFYENESYASFVRERQRNEAQQMPMVQEANEGCQTKLEARAERVRSGRLDDWAKQLPNTPASVAAAELASQRVGGARLGHVPRKDPETAGKTSKEPDTGEGKEEEEDRKKQKRWVLDKKGNMTMEIRRSPVRRK